MFGLKRKTPVKMDQSIESTIATAKAIADQLLEIGTPEGHVVTQAELIKSARFVADLVGRIYRDQFAAKGMSAQTVDLFSKPVEDIVFAKVRTYLLTKSSPFLIISAEGSA